MPLTLKLCVAQVGHGTLGVLHHHSLPVHAPESHAPALHPAGGEGARGLHHGRHCEWLDVVCVVQGTKGAQCGPARGIMCCNCADTSRALLVTNGDSAGATRPFPSVAMHYCIAWGPMYSALCAAPALLGAAVVRGRLPAQCACMLC